MIVCRVTSHACVSALLIRRRASGRRANGSRIMHACSEFRCQLPNFDRRSISGTGEARTRVSVRFRGKRRIRAQGMRLCIRFVLVRQQACNAVHTSGHKVRHKCMQEHGWGNFGKTNRLHSQRTCICMCVCDPRSSSQ